MKRKHEEPTNSEEKSSDPVKQNILRDWDNVHSDLAKAKFAIFLDYDGTLTPIVKNPSDAVMTSDTRKIVEELSRKVGKLAIVTGRSISTITKFVALDQLYYAGSHGYDIRGPNNEEVKQVAKAHLPELERFRDSMKEQLANVRGALVEDNVFSISVHYRNASDEDRKRIEEAVDTTLSANSTGLCKKQGKFVYEIRPRVDWNKGKAVRWMLDNVFNHDKVTPIYIGDDITDEDAFKELRSDKSAVCIFVRPPDQDRPTAANYVLDSTDEVKAFLSLLSKL